MVSHPNRGWRARWTVDLEAATAEHRDGWTFRFEPVEGAPGVFDGECVAQPDPFKPEHMHDAARIAREAGEIFVEARRCRN